MSEKILRIKGMSCSACANRVERVVKKLEGVEEASINFASETLVVRYDNNQLDTAQIEAVIEKAGYGVQKNIHQYIFKVEGMTCSACSSRVERIVRKKAGIEEATVNLASEKLTVSLDADIISVGELKAVVEKAGYKLITEEAKQKEKVKRTVEQTLLYRFIASACFAVPLLVISMGHMVGMPLPTIIDPHVNPFNFALIQCLLTLSVMLIGYKFYKVGIKNLIKLSPNMDSLIAVSTLAAFSYSAYAMWKIFMGYEHEYVMRLYFESAATILALITLGKYLEARSKGKTSQAIKKLMGLTPKTAMVIRAGKEVMIPLEEVVVGDIVVVKPGEKLPVDGEIIEGNTAIDEAMITGESIPIEKGIGSQVIGASINKTGFIKYKATKVGKDTALAQIIKLVEEAQGSKAPIAKLADVISGYFVQVVIGLAVIATILWLVAGESIPFALTIFIDVLVIACPCALGLATPTAIMVGTGRGAEEGILIKGGEALETTYKIDTVVLDKTGTITEGKPKVTDILLNKMLQSHQVLSQLTEKDVLALAASCEKGSEHPLGEAIVRAAKEQEVPISELEQFEAVPGHGIVCQIEGKILLLGNKKLMDTKGVSLVHLEKEAEELALSGKTPMYIALEGVLIGIIAVADTVKASSKLAIEKLHKMGLQVAMITGDHRKTAEAIAKEVGIDIVLAEVLPEDKANEVQRLQESGKRVAMVGDGINDAPALARADIGIAIGSGTDVAIESADIVLMHSDLCDVSKAIKLSKATIRNIKQNLFWAFGYNVLGIPVAMGLLYLFGGPLLNPMIAAGAMSLSSVSVLTNALRLRKFKA